MDKEIEDDFNQRSGHNEIMLMIYNLARKLGVPFTDDEMAIILDTSSECAKSEIVEKLKEETNNG